MPTYTYFCKANGKSVPVFHTISTRVRIWADLCLLAGIPIGDTPRNARVERELGAGTLLRAHGRGACCGDSGCK